MGLEVPPPARSRLAFPSPEGEGCLWQLVDLFGYWLCIFKARQSETLYYTDQLTATGTPPLQGRGRRALSEPGEGLLNPGDKPAQIPVFPLALFFGIACAEHWE